MAPMTDSGVERRAEVETHPPTSRPLRAQKRDTSPTSKSRHPKNSKPPEPPRRKDKPRKEQAEGENKERQHAESPEKSASTVVNVDTVREKGEVEKDELLGLLETGWQEESVKERYLGPCEILLVVLTVAFIVLFFPLSIWFCMKIVREHERAVVFRLGHLLRRKPRGPGLIFFLPFLDVCYKVDVRLQTLSVPSHTVVTKDLVSVELSAVCYYRIENLSLCYGSLAKVPGVLQGLVQVSDREILAHHTFTEILTERKKIGHKIQVSLDSVACKWGIKVERAEIEDLSLPAELQHNFAAEAEAKRQAQVKVIAAEGERMACEALKASMDALSGSPAALQLRLLQLLHSLQTDRSVVVLALPSDFNSLSNNVSVLSTTTRPGAMSDTNKESGNDSPMM
ncbi:podocin isoform X1 [Denticeps clupeoides]|uniref:Podocin n=1 Tax=Denticeps clupeoides TaxID=299321 RepID=A0AAY4BM07_9TELE|nr:podocin-like isoform X1 [Denticeps clupeoides]